ncbi:PAS domain S-box protein, partial [Methanoregula sp.]|uniref:PAS domain S-box protein n=1 Tax=Methanoregula sp. TaxID=2052170 RepID=UPI000CBE42E0
MKDITQPDDLSGDMESIRMLMDGKIPVYRTEKRYIRKDGSTLWGSLTVSALRSADGSVEYLIAQIEDITERKDVEIAIKKSEHQFRETLELLDEGYYHCTLDGSLIEHNLAFNRILGIEMSKNMRGIMMPEFWQDPHKREEYLKELMSKGFVRNMIIDAKTIDGKPITVLASAHLIRDEGRDQTIEGTFTDISDLRNTENALREEREFSHLLLDASPAFYVAIDSNGRTLMMNRALLDALEYTEDEVKGKDYLTSFVPPEDRESLQPVFEKNRSGTTTVNVNRIISKSGKIFIVEWHGKPVKQTQGKKVGFFVGVGIDITGRRTAETALRESEARLRSFIETTQDAITIIDEEGQVIEWNAGSERLSGISRADALGRFIWDVNFQLVPPERRTDTMYAELKESMKKALGTGIPVFREPKVFEAARLDGTRFFSRHTIFPIKTARGYRFGSVVQDITSEKLAEEALRETTRKLIEAQELAHLGFWSWDVKTGDVEWSDEIFRIFGLDPRTFKPTIDSVLARSPWPEDHERDKELIKRAIESHEPGTYEQRFLRPDNSTGYYYSTFQGRYDNSGNLVSIIGTVLDITKRKRTEEDLRESESRFRTLVGQMPVGIAMTKRTDKNEDVIYLNEKFTEITGYTKDAIPSFDTWAKLAYPDPEYRRIIAAMLPDVYSEAANNLTSNPRVTKVTCNDGTAKDIEFRYTNLKSFGFWTITDIT